MAPSVRRGQSADLPAVAELLNRAGLPTADLTSAHEFQTWVLEDQGSIVGVIGLERFGCDALLRSLTISAEYRRRGFGQKLVAHVEHDAPADGVTQLVLLTETAELFFRSLGYVVTDRGTVSDEVKRSAEFRLLCPVSAVCMIKSLQR